MPMAEIIRRRRRRVAMLVWGGMMSSWSGIFGEERGGESWIQEKLRWVQGYHGVAKLIAENSKVPL